MRPPLGSTMRVLQPAPGVFGFYDGRVPGVRAYSDAPNWLDDGAYELGICTYAIVSGAEALVYDTHISLDHARLIRRHLADAGVRHFRVVLSHWHDDHVAGNAIFADCEIIANRKTAQLLEINRHAIETANPPIRPLVMPNRIFDDRLTLTVGEAQVELRQMDIHSQDGTVMLLPGQKLLFAGDTLEDPITYVGEPGRLPAHLRDLDRLELLPFERILPDHGDPDIIADGGYNAGLIAATRRYIERLLLCPVEPVLAAMALESFLVEDAHSGVLRLFAPYEAVHRRNVEAVTTFAASLAPPPE